jgi:hypothetical protein
MQIERHGKLLFRKLEDNDLELLRIFCQSCKDLGYANNASVEAMKIPQMIIPYGCFFIGIDEKNNIIFNVAGIHKMPEINDNAYRALFRGAVLPGYVTNKGLLKGSWQFMVTLNQQIDFIRLIHPNAEFYLTSNKKQDHGKSSKIDRFFNPRAERAGIINLVDNDFYYMHTEQRLWKINVDEYKKWRLI